MATIEINTDQPARAWHEADHIHVELVDGRELVFPVSLTQRLMGATAEQRGRIRLLPFSLHWPEVDEDITVESLLALGYGK